MVLSAAYTHFTASSNAFRHPTAHIAGEVENTFSASMAELAKREYSFLASKYEKFDIIECLIKVAASLYHLDASVRLRLFIHF